MKRYFWKLYSPWFLQQSADEAVGILSGQRLRDVVAIGPLYICVCKEQASDPKLLSRSWHVRVFPKKEERWMVNYNTSLLRLSSVSDVMLTDCIARKHEPLVNKNKNYISFFFAAEISHRHCNTYLILGCWLYITLQRIFRNPIFCIVI